MAYTERFKDLFNFCDNISSFLFLNAQELGEEHASDQETFQEIKLQNKRLMKQNKVQYQQYRCIKFSFHCAVIVNSDHTVPSFD